MKVDIQYESTGPGRRVNSLIERYFKQRESFQLAAEESAAAQRGTGGAVRKPVSEVKRLSL